MKRQFVIDCDTGTDDLIAIVAALGCDEIEVRAITSVNGNVPEKFTSVNNLDLMAYLDKDIPVAKGAWLPFSGIETFSDGTHGPTGLGDYELPHTDRAFDPRIAAQVIYDEAVACKGELELLVTGPMTNVAIAFVEHPDLQNLIKHIWFMGGAARGGNVLPTAEFNIWIDPESAHTVMTHDVPMTMVGLDVTERAILKEEDVKELYAHGSKPAVLCADILDFMLRRVADGGEDLMMHDALALAAAVYPECLTFKDFYVDVECRGTYTRGHTYVDRRKKLGRPENVSVALDIDVPAFRRWLVDAIKRCA